MAMEIDILPARSDVAIDEIVGVSFGEVRVQHSPLVRVFKLLFFDPDALRDFLINVVGFHHVKVVVFGLDAVQISGVRGVENAAIFEPDFVPTVRYVVG